MPGLAAIGGIASGLGSGLAGLLDYFNTREAQRRSEQFTFGPEREPRVPAEDVLYNSLIGPGAFRPPGLADWGHENRDLFGGLAYASGSLLGQLPDTDYSAYQAREEQNIADAARERQQQGRMNIRSITGSQGQNGRGALLQGILEQELNRSASESTGRQMLDLGASVEAMRTEQGFRRVGAAQNLLAQQGAFLGQRQGLEGQRIGIETSAQRDEILSNLQTQQLLASLIGGFQFNVPQLQPVVNSAIGTGLATYQAFGGGQPGQKGGSVSGGFSILGTGGSFGSGGCVDGNAAVARWLPREKRWISSRLWKIKVGDWVCGGDGRPHKVIATDYGIVPDDQRNDHVVIVVPYLSPMLITRDHVIGGKAAGAWRAGQLIDMPYGAARIIAAGEAPYVVSGDLELADHDTYVAGGFVVHSNIGKMPWHLKERAGMTARRG